MFKISEHLPYSDNEDILAAVFTLNIQTPYLFTILYLKFEQIHSILLCLKTAGWILVVNSADPDLGPHCLLCQNTWSIYSI